MTADAAGAGAGDAAALPATLPAAIRVAASRWPDRIAWRFDPGGQLTFADVDRLTAGYAAVLRERGVQAGDRVALLIRNEVAFPLTWLALARPGYPARAGGPWLWRILVLSLFQAVVVPSGLRMTVQPLRWISTWW